MFLHTGYGWPLTFHLVWILSLNSGMQRPFPFKLWRCTFPSPWYLLCSVMLKSVSCHYFDLFKCHLKFLSHPQLFSHSLARSEFCILPLPHYVAFQLGKFPLLCQQVSNLIDCQYWLKAYLTYLLFMCTWSDLGHHRYHKHPAMSSNSLQYTLASLLTTSLMV